MPRGDEALVIRGVGLYADLSDISRVVVASRVGRPIQVGDLAVVRVGARPLSGLVAFNERDDVVQAIVQMAHTLGLRVVAEGVETELQRDELVSLGCDELQGYLFARPMTPAALALWAADDDEGTGTSGMFRPSLFEPTAPAAL
jgi:hypothetical protein